MSHSRSISALVHLLLAACSASVTEPNHLATVTTNRSVFVPARVNATSASPRYEITVVTSIRNWADAPLYLRACGSSPTPVYGVELVRPANTEGSAFNGAWACPSAEPHVLHPGAIRVDTLTLRAPSLFQDGRALGAISGTKRIIFFATHCPRTDGCVEGGSLDVTLRSDAFLVRLP